MMMAGGGGGTAVDHNGIYTNPNLHSLQQTHMDTDNPDSRKRPLETPAEEAGCTKRTNTGGKRKAVRSSSTSTSCLSTVTPSGTAEHSLQCDCEAANEQVWEACWL